MSSADKRAALKKLDLKNPWHLSAVGFGSGLSPIIPGTMGTLMAVPFYLFLMHLPLAVYIAVLVLGAWLGNHICQKASDAMQVHDHGGIVWDEFIGFWITMLPVLILGLPLYNWQLILAGFVLFRIFDMVKPWPISWL
ncbi:MAG: phosphatidylglycerophosphatase A, partial [Vibrio sp.]